MWTVNRFEPNSFGRTRTHGSRSRTATFSALHLESNKLAAFAVFTLAVDLLAFQVV